jgi:hypothetical protein
MTARQRQRAWRIMLGTSLVTVAISSLGSAAPKSRTSLKLFEARPVTSSGPLVTLDQAVPFDEVLVMMGCSAKPTATISSSADGSGGVVVDNIVAVNGVNVCNGQEGSGGLSCFAGYFGQVGDPALAAYGSIAPLDVRGLMPAGKKQVVTFQLKDAGGVLANSDLWLITNCVIHNKVELCHKPGTPAEHTIEVAQSSVSAHLAHGDYIGRCS